MGKGDKKTRRGKIAIGSFGKLRPKNKKLNFKPKSVKDKPSKK
jgi:30S ribosomal protein S31